MGLTLVFSRVLLMVWLATLMSRSLGTSGFPLDGQQSSREGRKLVDPKTKQLTPEGSFLQSIFNAIAYYNARHPLPDIPRNWDAGVVANWVNKEAKIVNFGKIGIPAIRDYPTLLIEFQKWMSAILQNTDKGTFVSTSEMKKARQRIVDGIPKINQVVADREQQMARAAADAAKKGIQDPGRQSHQRTIGLWRRLQSSLSTITPSVLPVFDINADQPTTAQRPLSPNRPGSSNSAVSSNRNSPPKRPSSPNRTSPPKRNKQ